MNDPVNDVEFGFSSSPFTHRGRNWSLDNSSGLMVPAITTTTHRPSPPSSWSALLHASRPLAQLQLLPQPLPLPAIVNWVTIPVTTGLLSNISSRERLVTFYQVVIRLRIRTLTLRQVLLLTVLKIMNVWSAMISSPIRML